MTTPAQRQLIRDVHRPSFDGRYCVLCADEWPCIRTKLLDELEAAETNLAAAQQTILGLVEVAKVVIEYLPEDSPVWEAIMPLLETAEALQKKFL